MNWIRREIWYAIAWVYTGLGRLCDFNGHRETAVHFYNRSVDYACRSYYSKR